MKFAGYGHGAQKRSEVYRIGAAQGMQHYANTEVFDYWVELCGDQAAPLRNQIDPMVLRRVLPHLFILDAASEGEPRFRLAGTRLCDAFDAELRGRPFRALWSPADAARVLDVCRLAVASEQPCLLRAMAEDPFETSHYEMLLLPLRPPTGTSDRLIGSLMPPAVSQLRPAPSIAKLALLDWSTLDRTGRELTGHAQQQSPHPSALQRLLARVQGSVGRPTFGPD
jgi:hypothetical protein